MNRPAPGSFSVDGAKYVLAVESERDAAVARVAQLEAALRRYENDAPTFCRGGANTCEDCVASCGIEEFEELVSEVLAAGTAPAQEQA